MVSRRGVRLFRMEQPVVLFSMFVPVGPVDLSLIERYCKGGHAHF